MTGSVVPENEPPTEAEFRAAMLRGLSRCANTPTGRRALAAEMDLSSKGLENILLRDAMPGPKRLWDALRACPTVLDDIAALYGAELVQTGIDPIAAAGTVPLATLLAKVAEAEAPNGDGGAGKTHAELLAMEADIRRVHAVTGQWINEITHLRSLRAVKTEGANA